MHIGRIQGATRTLGKAQGYSGLPVRDEVLLTSQGRVHCIASAWLPEPFELVGLNRGAALTVKLLSKEQPPMVLEVGVVPDSYTQSLRMQAELMACDVPVEVAAMVARRLMESGFKIMPVASP